MEVVGAHGVHGDDLPCKKIGKHHLQKTNAETLRMHTERFISWILRTTGSYLTGGSLRIFSPRFTCPLALGFPKSHPFPRYDRRIVWKTKGNINWLVVSTHLKNISQIGSSPQVAVKIKNV